MTDVKRSSRTRPKSKRKGGQRKFRVVRAPMLDQMLQRHTWDYGALSSGTTGIISFADMSPSIQNFTEYSTLSSLFSEVKLVSAYVEFLPLDNISSSHAQGILYVGTRQDFNKNVTSVPTSVSQVENLKGMRTISTSIVKPVRVRLAISTRGLEFSQISADAPSPVIDYAGSPGCLIGISGSGTLNNSIKYFYARLTAVHHFRGRV